MTCLSGGGHRDADASGVDATDLSADFHAEWTGVAGTGTPATTPASPHHRTVELGARVRVRDTDGEHAYTIVERVRVGARPGSVSVGSPVGRALLGRGVGDRVEVQTPGGVRRLTVLAVTVPEVAPSPRSPRPCEA
jgi:Transcription elongation factor, GreA/GreB, C-term